MKKIKITKKHLAYLFSGLGTALIIFILGIVLNPEEKVESEINFGEGTIIEDGNFAGRDIIIEADDNKELIAILSHRAEVINSELNKYYYYSDIREYLKQFNDLHAQVILALKNGDNILAHELIVRIHRLSFRLESTEQLSMAIEELSLGSGYHYPQMNKSVLSGSIIHAYIYGDFKKESNKNQWDLKISPFTDKFNLEEAEVLDTIKKYAQQPYLKGYHGKPRFNYNYKDPEKIARILLARGKDINKNLKNHYSFINVEEVLKSFNQLNNENITAICDGKFIGSHQILTKIFLLSLITENTEMRARDSANLPTEDLTIKSHPNSILGKLGNKYLLDKWAVRSDSLFTKTPTFEIGVINVYDSILAQEESLEYYKLPKDTTLIVK